MINKFIKLNDVIIPLEHLKFMYFGKENVWFCFKGIEVNGVEDFFVDRTPFTKGHVLKFFKNNNLILLDLDEMKEHDKKREERKKEQQNEQPFAAFSPDQ